MKSRERLSPYAKDLWLLAAVGAVAVGFMEFYKYQPGMPHYRQATPQEKMQIDKILRPAAVSAAKTAIKFYAQYPLRGFTQKPATSSILTQPRNAVELYVQGPKYSINVDMQRHDKQLDPNTVYDVDIFTRGQKNSTSISSENLNDGYIMSEFLYADTGDQTIIVDLMDKVTDSDIKQANEDAKKIASVVNRDVAAFSGVK